MLAAQGIGLEQLMQRVSELTGIPLQAMTGSSKTRENVKARSLLCFWAVKELGMTLTVLANRLGISVPTVSVAVRRGEQMADREKLEISTFLNVKT